MYVCMHLHTSVLCMSVQDLLEEEEDRVLVDVFPSTLPQFPVTMGKSLLPLVQHGAMSSVQPLESLRNLERSDGAALERQMVTRLQ